jgi:quinone-modifying oxidoreductase subunit QmoC
LSGEIVYHYSNIFPHWLLNSFFFLFSALALVVMAVGARRFWRAMTASNPGTGNAAPAKRLYPAVVAVLKSVFTHDRFAKCEKSRSRYWSHSLVFFGFLGLGLVSFWVVTARINPIVRGDFIYPFNFLSPWKILANAGGIALLAGLYMMIRDRVRKSEEAGAGGYFDWALLGVLLMVLLTGFFTEVLHYVRLEPHRHIAYFVHLVFVFALLMYLPYSKFAHIVYRTIALIHAQLTGRESGARPALAAKGINPEEVKEDDHARTGE